MRASHAQKTHWPELLVLNPNSHSLIKETKDTPHWNSHVHKHYCMVPDSYQSILWLSDQISGGESRTTQASSASSQTLRLSWEELIQNMACFLAQETPQGNLSTPYRDGKLSVQSLKAFCPKIHPWDSAAHKQVVSKIRRENANSEVTKYNWVASHVLCTDILSGWRDMQAFEKRLWHDITILNNGEKWSGQMY